MGMFYILLCYTDRDGWYDVGCLFAYRREASRCSFRQTGQCESLTEWSEQQVLASRFFYYLWSSKEPDDSGIIKRYEKVISEFIAHAPAL